MLKEIYNDYGVQIVSDGNHYFARFDRGGVAAVVREITITCEEAQELMSIKDSYEVTCYIRSGPRYNRWMHCRPVHDDVGDTMKLFMGRD